MVECFENDHKVNSKCFICNSFIVLLRDDLNTVYIVKIRIIWVYRLCSYHLESHEYIRGWILTIWSYRLWESTLNALQYKAITTGTVSGIVTGTVTGTVQLYSCSTGIVQSRYSYWIDLRDYTSSTGSGTQYSCSLYGLRSTCVKDMCQCVYSRLHTVEYSRVSLQVQRSAFQFGLRLWQFCVSTLR